MLTLDHQSVQSYISLLKEYNEHTNIYSKSAYQHLEFHVQDSLLLSTLCQKANRIVDMGSGSGLPSALLAIALPDTEVIAIESKSRKRKFLFHVKQSLNLSNYTIFEGDVQFFTSFNKERIDCVTAKAYKPPKDAWLDAKKVLSKSGNKSGALYIPVSKKQIKEVKALKKAKLLKRSIKTLDDPLYYACFT